MIEAAARKRASSFAGARTLMLVASLALIASAARAATNLPALIQAEDYDTGGQYVGYWDSTNGNTGGAYRTDDVDIEWCWEGGADVSYVTEGEWLKYTVNVATAGNFDIDLRVARGAGGTSYVHVQIDGKSVTGRMDVPSTGGWQNWTTLTSSNVYLSAGTHTVVVLMGGGFNFNWIQFRSIGNDPAYRLVFEDRFDGPGLDGANWSYVTGWGRNNELEYYTSDPANVRVENGDMVIEGHNDWIWGFQYTSGRVVSSWKKDFQYGKIQARISTPSGKGLWPAFWMLGRNYTQGVPWPNCGEIDVMEQGGSYQWGVRSQASVHGPGYSGLTPITGYYWAPTNLANAYHVYEVSWDYWGLTFYVDGNQYYYVNRYWVPGQWVFDNPMYLIFNLALGGDYDGAPDWTTPWPNQMKIDWVRAYQAIPNSWVISASGPSVIDANGASGITVNFSNEAAMDMLVDLVKTDGTQYATSRQTYLMGWNQWTTQWVGYAGLPSGDYNFVVRIVPIGGDSTQAMATYNVPTSVPGPLTGSCTITVAPELVANTDQGSLQVTYTANRNADIILDLVRDDNLWVAGTRQTVTSGTNAPTWINWSHTNVSNGNYHWVASLVPIGANFTSAVDTDQYDTVVVCTANFTIANAPRATTRSGTSPICIQYTTSDTVDVIVDIIRTSDSAFFGEVRDTAIPPAMSKYETIVISRNNLAVGDYAWHVHLLPPGKDWTYSLAFNQWSFIVESGVFSVTSSPPDVLPSGQFSIGFNYSAERAIDFMVDVLNTRDTWYVGSRKTLSAGNNINDTLTFSYSSLPPDSYAFHCHLVPVGQQYNHSIADSYPAFSVNSGFDGFTINTTAPGYFYAPPPVYATANGTDTVWYNPTGSGANQVDTIVADVRLSTESAVYGSSAFVAVKTSDSGVGRDTFELAYKIPQDSGSRTIVVQAVDKSKGYDTANIRFQMDTIPPAAATLVLPDSGRVSGSDTVNFEWNFTTDTMSGVGSYRIQACTSTNFVSLVFDSAAGNTTLGKKAFPRNDTYFWRVIAVDNVGNTVASSFRTIIVDTSQAADVTSPNAFTLLSPTAGEDTNLPTVTFRWSAATDSSAPVVYRLIVDTDMIPPYLLDRNGLAGTADAEALPPNDTYQWHVIASDAVGNTTQEGDSFFVVDTKPPTIASPTNPIGGVYTTSPISAQWNAAADSLSGLLYHRIQMDATGTFSGAMDIDSYCPAADSPLTLGRIGRYYFRVIAYDRASNTATSATDSFNIYIPETAPPVPANPLSPAQATETRASVILFRWQEAFDSTLPVTYRFIMDTDMAGSYIIDTTVDTNFATIAVPANDTFLWRIVARDAINNSATYGDSRILVDTKPPTTPTLVSPRADTLVLSPVTLDWNASADSLTGFLRYRLQVDTFGTFAGVLVTDSYQPTPDTTLVFSRIGRYFWRVIAEDKVGNTAISAFDTFYVYAPESVPPTNLDLSAPADVTETRATSITFRWTAANDSTPPITYRLIVDTDMAGSYLYDTSFVNRTSATLALPANDTYRWRVIATDALGNSVTIGDSKVVIDTVPPTAGTLVAPVNDTISLSSVFLDWNAATDTLSGVRRYRLLVNDIPNFTADTPAVDTYVIVPDTTITLPVLGQYFWTVITEDDAGNTTTVNTETFRVYSPETSPPESVQMILPGPWSATRIETVVFRWTAGGDSTPPLSYHLIVDTDMMGSYTYETVTRALFVAAKLPANDTYRWRLVASDALGNSATFGDSYFWLDTGPPTKPVLVKPISYVETYGQLFFDWNASADSLSGVLRYRIQIDTLGTFSGPKSVDSYTYTPDTSFTLALDTYYWRVIAEDSAGNTETSTTDSFRNRIVPDTPVIDRVVFSSNVARFFDAAPFDTGPAGDTVWFAADSMYVTTTVFFTATIRGSIQVGAIFDSGAQTDTSDSYQAFFAIRSTHATADTWTTLTVRSTQNITDTLLIRFRPDTTPPDTVTIVSPRGESVSATPTFTWTASSDSQSGISYYRVEVSGRNDFATLVDWGTTPHPDTDLALFFPLADSTYYLRVLAYDSCGNTRTTGIDVETFLVAQGFDTTKPNIWYVNDGSTAGDTFTLAVGNSANNGYSRTSPKRFLNDLEGMLTAGDTVYVDAGSYAEPDTFDIDTQCWIIGADSQLTFVSFGDSNTRDKSIRVNAGGVSISNLNVKDAFFGVHINGVDSCTVWRVEAQHCNAGMVLESGSIGNRIENCHMHHDAWVGLYLAAATQNRIIGNHIHDHGSQGMILDWSSDWNRLSGNIVHWNTNANIELMQGSDSNWCDSNVTYGGGQEGFKVTSSDSNICEYNTSNGNTWGAFAVVGTAKQNIFRANSVPQNNDQGFYINAGVDNLFDSNIIANVGSDGFFVQSDSQIFRNNSVNIASQEGFNLNGPNFCVLESNVVIKATNYGYYLHNNADSNTVRWCRSDSTTATDAYKIESSAYDFIQGCYSTASASAAFSVVTGAHHNTITTCTSTRDVIGLWSNGGGNNTYDNIRMYYPTWRAVSVLGSNDSYTGCFITGGSNNGFYADGPAGAANNLYRQNQLQYISWAGFEIVGSSGNRFETNTVYGCSAEGFLLRETSANNVLQGNSSIRNTNGFRLDTYCTNNRLIQNLAETNTAHGFWIRTHSDSCYLASNTARGNALSGFTIRASDGCTMLQNTSDSNGKFGFSIESNVSTFSFVKNNILLGGGAGFNADIYALNLARNWWGTTDSQQIRNRIGGGQTAHATYLPFRLGVIDTAAGADTVAPTKPDTVDAVALTESTIQVSWSVSSGSEEPEAAAGLNGYRIYSSRVKDTSYWPLLAQVGAGVNTLIDSNVALGDTRYYRVTALDAATYANEAYYSDSKPGARTTNETVPPSDFTLSLPVQGTETRATTVMFRWTAATDSSNPISYRLIVDTDMTGAYVVDTTVSDSAAIVTLRANDTYFWRVVAADSWGNTRTIGDSRLVIDTAPPTAPGLLLPAGATETSQTTVAFTWSASTDALTRVVNYRLQAAADALFATLVADSSCGTATSGTLSLAGSRTYYWRVVAYDAAGCTAASSSLDILVDTTPPVPGTIVSPADGLETQSTLIRFVWSPAMDSHSGLAGYRLQIDTDGDFAGMVRDSATGLDTAGWLTLPANDTYVWRVLVVDDAGNTAALAPRTIVVDTLPPETGALSLPADLTETNVTSIFFSWQAGYDTHSGIARYRIQVDTDGDFLGLVADSSTGLGLSGVVTLPANDTYRWRILIVDDAGNARATETRTLVIDTMPPPVPALVTPVDGAETNAALVWFDWDSSVDTISGVSRYRLQVDTAGTFSGMLSADTVFLIVSPTPETGLALAEGSYSWRIAAIDDAGNSSSYSASRRVIVDRTAPVFVTLKIASSPSVYFSDAGGIDTSVREDTVYFNANGGGAGQKDTVTVTASGADRTIFPTVFDTVATTDTTAPFQQVFTIASGTTDTAMAIQIGDTAGNRDTYMLHWVRDYTAPPAAALTSPSNGQVQGATTPTLSWLASVDTQAGTRGYEVQVSRNAPFTSIVEDSFEYAASHTTTTLPDSTYYWRVIPYDSCGNADTASATAFSFSVDSRIPRITGLSIVSTSPLFFFDDTPITPGAVADTVWYNPTGAGAAQIDTITVFVTDDNETAVLGSNAFTVIQGSDLAVNRDSYTLAYQIAMNAPSATISVTAIDSLAFQDTAWIRFELDTRAPNATVPTAPVNGHETSAATITFAWAAGSDTQSGLREYRIQVDTDGNFTDSVVDSSVVLATSATLTLRANDTYVWRVVAVDRVSNTAASTTETLVIDTAPPTAATPTLPADRTDTLAAAIAFSWGASTDALSGVAGYRLQIDRANTFAVLVVDSFTPLTSGSRTLAANDTYYWRLVTVDNAGNTAAATSRMLRIDTAGPNAGSLTAPADNLDTTSTTFAFAWTSAHDSQTAVSYYRLQIDTALSFAAPIVDSATPLLTATRTLAPNDTYWWRVLAVDSATNTTAYSSRLLRIDTVPPFAVTLIRRVGAACMTPVTLQWVATTDTLSGLSLYNVQIDTAGTFSTLLESATTFPGDTVWISALSTVDTYYWRVLAYDTAGNFSVSSGGADSFRLVQSDTTPPAAFNLTAPTDLTETRATTILLRWQDALDSSTPVRYDVQLDTAGTFAAPYYDTSWLLDTFVAAPFRANETTTWRVIAKDASGNTTVVSATRRIVCDTGGPAAFALTFPAAQDTRATAFAFAWSASFDTVSGLANYRLQVDTSLTFAVPIVDDSTYRTIDTRTINPNDTYYWRVIAFDDAGNTTAIAPIMFRVDTVPPAAFALTAPAAGTDTNATTIFFAWTASADALTGLSTYRLQINNANSFAAPLIDSTTSLTNGTRTLPANDTYYWRVVAVDNAGNTTTVSANILRVDTAPPVAGALTNPAAVFDTSSLTIAFAWSSASDTITGVKYYRLQIDTSAAFAAPLVDSQTPLMSAARTLAPNDTYWWRVLAVDSATNATAYASRIVRIDTAPPTQPALTRKNGGVDTVPVAFAWTAATDTISGLAFYVVQVDTAGTFAVLKESATVFAGTTNYVSTVVATDTYYWRVLAYDTAGNFSVSSGGADSYRITTVDTTPPSAFTLTSPLDPVESSVSAVLLRWADAFDSSPPVRYEVQIDTAGGNFSAPYFDTTGLIDTFVTGVFRANDTSLWRVIAKDNAGNTRVVAAAFLFVCDTYGPTAPALNTPSSPLDTNNTTIGFSWNAAVDTISGVNGYRLQIDTSAGFAAPIVDQFTTLTTLSRTLSANDTYWWRVIAIDDAGNTTVTAARIVRIDTAPPLAGTLTAPANPTDTRATTISFAWTAATETQNPTLTYRLQIDTASTFLAPFVDSATPVTAGSRTLPANDSYYWRVVATDSVGNSSAYASSILRIDTAGPTAPSAVIPVDPHDTTNTSPTFRWSASSDSGVVTYRLQIDTAGTFAAPLVDTTTSGLQLVVTLPPNDTYFWRVVATDSAGNSTVNAMRRLRIDIAPPSTVALVTFRGDSTPPPVTLRWAPATDNITGVRSYIVQIDTAGTFAFLVESVTTAHPDTDSVSGLIQADTYFWRVIALDTLGNASISAIDSFVLKRTDTVPPSAFSLASPTIGTNTTALAITFRWANSLDDTSPPVRYNLQIDTTGTFAQNVVDTSWLIDTFATFVLPANDTYFWRVIARDNAWNTTVCNSAFRLAVDTRPPTTPTLVAPRSGDTSILSAVMLDWNASFDSIAGLRRYRVQVDTLGTFAGALVVDSYQSVPDTIVVLGRDTFYWRVFAEDNLGNTSVSSRESFVIRTLDTAPPVILTASAAPSIVYNDTRTTVTFTVNAVDSSVVASVVADLLPIGLADSTAFTFAGGTTWTLAAVFDTPVTGGAYALRITAIDAANNASTSTVSVTVTDSSPTMASIEDSPLRAITASGNALSIMSGIADSFASVRYEYRPLTGAWTLIRIDTQAPFWGIYWDISGLPAGDYDIRAVATDNAGHVDPNPTTLRITINNDTFTVKEYDTSTLHVRRQRITPDTSAVILIADGGTELDMPHGSVSETVWVRAEVWDTVPPYAFIPSGMRVPGRGSFRVFVREDGKRTFDGDLTIELPYDDTDPWGDRMGNTDIQEKDLAVYHWDEFLRTWVKEPNGWVDWVRNVACARVRHFTLFAVLVGQPAAANLSGVVVYPNPFVPYDNSDKNGRPFNAADPTSGILFDSLPPQVSIQVFDVAGRLVSTMSKNSADGRYQWDGRSDDGRELASGVYVIVFKTATETVIRKLMIIR